ncbi:MAG TPA: hypothetical protein DEO60_07870 [Bacteroidales bacterium]|jgi:hypothetical protein|nr:hypothetical protein [Bacteroidales bacterium]HBZ21027.1 hypothetical protein [Bacteroidales bacterium]
MQTLLQKLNYKGQKRIVVFNAEKSFKLAPQKETKDIQIDNEIDLRYPYDFMIIFVRKSREVEEITPVALHNLAVDGILWFCYPKKTSKKYSSDINRDNGWKALNDLEFYGIRLVTIDEDWSAMRFRNIKYIKSTSDRFIAKKI